MKNTWHAVEFAQNTFNARKNARALWDRTNDLHLLIETIGLSIEGQKNPLSDDLIKIIKAALDASNSTLDELARKCFKLGDRDDLSRMSQILRPISFTLSADSIRGFEQRLQTNIISVHTALYLLDRRDNKVLFEGLLNTIEKSTKRRADQVTAPRFVVRDQQLSLDTTAAHKENTPVDKVEDRFSDDILKALDLCTGLIDIEPQRSNSTTSLSPVQLDDQAAATNHPFPDTLDDAQRRPSEDCIAPSQSTRDAAVNRASGPPNEEETLAANRTMANIRTTHQDDETGLQHLLNDGISIREPDEQGFTALMHAVYQHGDTCTQCVDCVHMLLRINVDINATNAGQTALHLCVEYNHLDIAEALLERGADVNISSPSTPLLLAVQNNKAEFVKLFLGYSPDVKVVDNWNWNLVHHAIKSNAGDALFALLQRSRDLGLDLDLDARCHMDLTPLMHLTEYAHLPVMFRFAEMILDHGADVNATDTDGCSALYHTINGGSYTALRDKLVKMLLDRKADIDAVQRQLPERTKRFPALVQYIKDRRRDSGVGE